MPSDPEPRGLHLRQAPQRIQGPQAVDRQADVRPDRPGRILVGLVQGYLGPDPPERDRGRRAGHAAAYHRYSHESLLESIFIESKFSEL